MNEQELIKAIKDYINKNGIDSLNILMKQAWDNGHLVNVTVSIEKHGTTKFGNEY